MCVCEIAHLWQLHCSRLPLESVRRRPAENSRGGKERRREPCSPRVPAAPAKDTATRGSKFGCSDFIAKTRPAPHGERRICHRACSPTARVCLSHAAFQTTSTSNFPTAYLRKHFGAPTGKQGLNPSTSHGTFTRTLKLRLYD